VQRGVRRFAGTRIGALLFSRVLRPVDAVAWRTSGGRWTVASVGAGLPVIRLVTTGARSGLPRIAPLVGVPVDGGLLVIGSNFGQRAMPGWAVNLARDPRASVQYRGRTAAVRAESLAGDAAAGALGTAARIYPPFVTYVERLRRHRDVPIFLLVAGSPTN
jgi:deazaflavin-dependent oxidoreductase (nitroreductase family)